ncbi:hypothetical protein [Nostoc sp. TCL26-01]|uniref:hypothetical protein n=1 Tax=Nostoc sp. TCL26-01 TaxID=2576904 RepID=UPI0015BADDE3|nr:hypothetical protein [Nostoc sp. TCL26-01]
MPEKLVQAAIITFLLHVIAGLNTNNRFDIKVASPSLEPPASIVSLWRSLR